MSVAPRRALTALLLLSIAACDALTSCLGCESGDHLAKLLQTEGEVNRDLAASVGYWSTALPGATFQVGDGLRTSEGSVALVEVRDAGQLRLGSETTIRFRANADQKPNAPTELAFDVESGEAVVEAGKRSVPLRTRFGLAVLEPGAQLRIGPAENGQQRYQVDMGAATFFTEQGEAMQVPAGRSVLVGIGLAELEPDPSAEPAPTPTEPSEPPDAGAPLDTKTPDAGAGSEEPSPTDTVDATDSLPFAELVFEAAQSVQVLDPAPPTILGIQTMALCPEGAEVQLGSQRVRGAGQINVRVAAGAHRYEVACKATPGRVVARGRVRVMRNDGTRRLPSTAPQSRVETDGRRYTVMYQSLVPRVVVRWPNPPAAKRYALFVRNAGGTLEKTESAKAEVTIEPGKLSDGVYAVFFSALDAAGQRSKETTIDVRFDNAAPMASLQQPPVAGFERAEQVRVVGVALPGSSVSAAGHDVPVDAQGRFQGEVTVSGDAQALALRFQHPQHGVRYYIRRVAGAAR